MKSSRTMWGALLLVVLSTTSQAQILIGQTAGFSGAVAAGVKETTEGAKLYINAINTKGGINGEKIELISLDDKFDPKLSAENARILIEDKNVMAMFLTRGTPHTEAIIPLLNKHGVPLIGPSTGAMSLRQPVLKHVFNVRTSYQHEAEKAIAHLALIGITRIAVVYVDDSFGADALTGAQTGLATAKLTPVALEKIDRAKPDPSKIAPLIVKADAQAVVIIASGGSAVECIKAVKAAGSKAQIVTLSNNASSGFVQSLGELGRNVIVTQVFPRSFSYALFKEATDMAREKNIPDVSPAMFEGFSAAKVLVEALRRTNGKPSREHIQTALEGMSKFDLGGLFISYSAKDHMGLDFTELSIISSDGKFRR